MRILVSGPKPSRWTLTFKRKRRISRTWRGPSSNSRTSSAKLDMAQWAIRQTILNHSSCSNSNARTEKWNWRIRWRIGKLRSSRRISRWANILRMIARFKRTPMSALDSETSSSRHLYRMTLSYKDINSSNNSKTTVCKMKMCSKRINSAYKKPSMNKKIS